MWNLKIDKSITIHLTDKGNGAIVMDYIECNKKIEDVIQKDNYQILHKNPTTTIERKLYHKLRKQQDHID